MEAYDSEDLWEEWEERMEEVANLLIELDDYCVNFWRSEEEGWFYDD